MEEKYTQTYEEISRACEERLEALYGEPPREIRARLDGELSLLGKHSPMYWIAHRLVKHLQECGAMTGYRHAVGSTLTAYLLGISDINPLPAHYLCPACHHTEFAEAASGYDLPPRCCPRCGKPMTGEGQNIPWETALGPDGRKEPNMDIQTTTAMAGETDRFLKRLVGKDRIVLDEANQKAREQSRTYAFLPHGAQREDALPALRGLPRLDVLHREVYDRLTELFSQTGTKPEDIDYHDPKVYRLFRSGDLDGIDEFSTEIAKKILSCLEDIRFSTLVRVSGMLHGINVWKGNGEHLVNTHPFPELVSHRDDVFLTLCRHGVPRHVAFEIMEDARKGKLPGEGKYLCDTEKNRRWLKILNDAKLPQWYIDSLGKVFYLTPKAYAAHCTKLAVTLAWFKVYHREVFDRVMHESGTSHTND